MARIPQSRPERTATLAETLFYFSDRAMRDQLEEYRTQFESIYGATDLTKRYTSTWPQEQQDWLLEHEPKRYFEGLPPFVKAFIKAKMQAAARTGNLDDMPTGLQRLYVSGQMAVDARSR